MMKGKEITCMQLKVKRFKLESVNAFSQVNLVFAIAIKTSILF